ncbi:MAG: DUF4124 domain-containing protein [Steroidobacteraceae bacterium]
MLHQTVRLIALLLATSFAVAALADGTVLYRSVDRDGVTRYSDRPSPGAKRVVIGGSEKTSEGANEPAAVAQLSAAVPAASAAEPQARNPGYSVCELAEPTKDQVFINVESVSARLKLEPGLQQGHKAYALFDGKRIDGGTIFTISPIFRGQHRVSAVVENEDHRVVCQAKAVTFYVRQPTVIPLRERGGRR